MLLATEVIFLVNVAFAFGYLLPIMPRFPLKGMKAPPGSPWPQPHVMVSSHLTVTLDPHAFKISTHLKRCDVITEAIKRYENMIFFNNEFTTDDGKQELLAVRLHVTSNKCEPYPQEDMDEKYHLNIWHDKPEAVIRAHSVWGALRGLETMSQLVYQNDNLTYVVNATHIHDSPRFSHRGVLLDSARHFINKSIIMDNLDAMSYNKMNVFHWHLTDDQSFPYESTAYPELSRKGAFSSRHVYTQQDVADVIEHARLRGIRVIPEFSVPGHSWSWGKSHTELLTPCYGDGVTPDTANYPHHSERETMNPMLNSTYAFLKNFFKEISEVFHDRQLHMGISAANKECWKSNPSISYFMRKANLATYSDLEVYFARKILESVHHFNRTPIIWQDLVVNGSRFSNNPIVQVWKDESIFPGMLPWQQYMTTVVKAGYTAVLSSCWYLNMISYKNEWREYYKCDPHDFPGSRREKERVVGGEACLWGTFVDGTNLTPRLWPRASAVAERLWSKRSVNDTESAKYRLDDLRCHMIRRGINAQPVFNGYCDVTKPFKRQTASLVLDSRINNIGRVQHVCNNGHFFKRYDPTIILIILFRAI